MFDRILVKMRDRIRNGQYVLTIHAEEEMDEDGLNVIDVEECILTGRIVERQKDRAAGEWKYVIVGRTTGASRASVVARIGPTDTVIVLTVFATQNRIDKMTEITCDICGKTGARLRRVTRTYGKGKSELLIRGVPVISCPHCGESYLTAETLRSLERIKRDRDQVAVEQPVRVARFKRVA